MDRFGPVDVLEFYASTEGNAILANVSGKRIGSVGRPLPGSAEVRLAAWNIEENTPVYTPFGYVRPSERGEAGMMLARVERERGAIAGKPRAVVAAGKALFYTQLEQPIAGAYAAGSKAITLNMLGDDAAEGVGAFIAKRKPRWER